MAAAVLVGVSAVGALLPGDGPSADPLDAPTTTPATLATSTTFTTTTPPASSPTTTIGYEPFTVSGTGNETIEFRAPDDLATVLHITHSGETAFGIITLDGEAEPIETLVDTVGEYDGSRAINLLLGDVISSIEVVADGDWSITATYLGDLERDLDVAEGHGDAVLVMDLTSPAMTIAHDGASRFSVFMWTFQDQGYLVEGNGPVDETVSVPLGGVVVEVEADGNWRLSTKG